MADLTGRSLGPYRVLEQLGVGGMATVYKAYHAVMDRYVAIKVLPDNLARDPSFRTRFEREARTIARLEHRHILPVYDVAEDDGIPYLVMRFTDGGDLSGLIGSGTLSIPRAAALVAQVADALDYAHRQGVIHRDVKPANVLIGRDGDALLSDFGIAKIYSEAQQLTSDGMMVGTPAYMAPEQLKGQTVDGRTDIYSLGVVLYQALTGECPFVAETPLAVAMMHVHNPLRPPRQINPGIPDALERIILRSMAKNADDRFQTAGAMAQALRAAVASTPATQSLELPESLAPAPSASLPTPPSTPLPAQESAAQPALPPAPPTPVPTAAPPRRAGTPWLPIAGGFVALVVIGVAAFALLRGPSSGTGTQATSAAVQPLPASADALDPAVADVIAKAAQQLDAGDTSAATETLKPALEASPDEPNLLALRGIANLSNSGPDAARADIDRALSLAPNNPLVHFARGFVNQRTDRPDDAIADYSKAIELDPTFARAYYQRSILMGYPKNDTAAQRRDLDRTIELEPAYIPARIDRAWLLYYAAQEAQALPDIEQVLSTDANNSAALRLRGLIYARQGKIDEARRDFAAAVAAAPDDGSLRRDELEFLVRQHDFEKALVDADKIVALDESDPQRYTLRGFVLHALGRDEQALQDFEKALLIGGNETWPARYGRGLVFLANNRAQEALDELLAIQEHSDDTSGVSELFFGTWTMPAIDLARAYQALGQSDKSMATLDAALQNNETFEGFFERGRARAAAGNRDGAREDFQEALRRATEAKNDQQRAQVEAELAKIQ